MRRTVSRSARVDGGSNCQSYQPQPTRASPLFLSDIATSHLHWNASALAGGGVTLLADWVVRDDVSAGRLTRVLEQYEVNPGRASTAQDVKSGANGRS